VEPRLAIAVAFLASSARAAGKQVVGAHTTCHGALEMAGLGGSPLYVTGAAQAVDGGKLTMGHFSAVSVTRACTGTWDPYQFEPFRLLGQTLSFKVDLSNVSCACALAVYFVSEPAKLDDGTPATGTCDYSPYYCDASGGCGNWCPELDVMEANTDAFAATPHTCDYSPTAAYHNCDHGGRGERTRDRPDGLYGRGPGHTIDTTSPFEVRSRFIGGSSGTDSAPNLTRIETTLAQAGRTVVLVNRAPPEYLAQMAKAMDGGMAMRISYWGSAPSAMSWLDPHACPTAWCNAQTSGAAVLWDFRMTPGYPEPTPWPGYLICMCVLAVAVSMLATAALYRRRFSLQLPGWQYLAANLAVPPRSDIVGLGTKLRVWLSALGCEPWGLAGAAIARACGRDGSRVAPCSQCLVDRGGGGGQFLGFDVEGGRGRAERGRVPVRSRSADRLEFPEGSSAEYSGLAQIDELLPGPDSLHSSKKLQVSKVYSI